MRRRDRPRTKSIDLHGMMGGFLSKVDSALEKLGAFKTTKLGTLLQHALSRLAILKNQRRLRCAHAKTDIVRFLQQGHRDLALHCAESMVNERNMLEVFDMVQNYCNLLVEKAALLKHQKKCPNELSGAIAGLIFVSSRCNELPELDDVRSFFAGKFGSAFATSAVELQDGCRVNAALIEKLSKTELSLNSKSKVVMDIASEKGIQVNLEQISSERVSEIAQEETNLIQNMNYHQPTPPNSGNSSGWCSDEDHSESTGMDHKCEDNTSTVQREFHSAISTAVMKLAELQERSPDGTRVRKIKSINTNHFQTSSSGMEDEELEELKHGS